MFARLKTWGKIREPTGQRGASGAMRPSNALVKGLRP
jgi:hypothetical protein